MNFLLSRAVIQQGRVFQWMNLDCMVVQNDHIVMDGDWLSVMESMLRSIGRKDPQHIVSG